MAFRPVNFEEGRLVRLRSAASVAFVKGHACIASAVADATQGYMVLAASGTAVDIRYIAAETVTTGAVEGTMVEFYKVDPSVRINADCDDVVSTADQGTYCDLATVSTLNPDATTNDLFFIEKADTSADNGAVETTTVVYGYFVGAVPNS